MVLFCTEVNKQAAGSTGTALRPPTVCLEQQQQRTGHLEQHVADLLGMLGCTALQQLAVL